MVIRMKYYGRQKFLLIRLPHIGELSNQCKSDFFDNVKKARLELKPTR